MSRMKKVLCLLLSVCMILPMMAVGVFADSCSYEFVLPNITGRDVIRYENVQNLMTDSDMLFSLMYNSTHYDEIGEDRPDPTIVYTALDGSEEITEETSVSPLECIEYGGYYEGDVFFPGNFDLVLDVTDFESGVYRVEVNLTVPQGKGMVAPVGPIKLIIEELTIPETPAGGAGGSGGSTVGKVDRTSVSDSYYEAAKVCYDLGIMENVYEDSKKNVTRGAFAEILVNLLGAQDIASSMAEKSYLVDIENGSYLAGCATYVCQMGIMSEYGDGYFKPDEEVLYEEILKTLIASLGYDVLAKDYGGYPNGYLAVASRIKLSKGFNGLVGETVTFEALSQAIYNALFSTQLVVDSYSAYGNTYKEVDESFFYSQGYEKYVGEVNIEGNLATVEGTLYNLKNLKGTETVAEELVIVDKEIKDYPDNGMVLFVDKNGKVLSGLKHYSADFTINNGEEIVESEYVALNIDEIGYTYYKIDGSDALPLPENDVIEYRLSDGCNEKTVEIELLNSDQTVSETVEKAVILRKLHILEYHVDGEVFTSVEVPCGEKIPELEVTPEKEGYEFVGWDGLPEVMPHSDDFYVKARFSKIETENPIFEWTLPNQEAEIGKDFVIYNIEELVDEDLVFGLIYASDSYAEYIEEPAVYTFTNEDDTVTYSLGSTPLANDGGEYNLTIPVKEELEPGTYTLVIDLPIAKYKNASSVRPYKFTIEEFVVTGEQGGNEPDQPGDEEPDDDEEDLPNTTFTVMDTTELTPVKDAQIFISNEEGTVNETGVTDENGAAQFKLDDGSYSVQVIADGYEMRNFVIEKTKENCEFTPYLNKNSLLDIKTSVKEMTKQDMIDAGIDVNAMENKHVYNCITVLKFVPVEAGGDVTITPIEITFDYVYDEDGTIIKANPAHVGGKVIYPVSKDIYLIIHSETTWLKEMFDVQLVVANTSSVENIEDCVASLNLPDGLSLAVMLEGEQSVDIDMGTIEPMGTSDIHWYLCGDKEGEYLLNGNVTAKRVGGGITEPLKAAFVMQEPITVLAGNAMKLVIEAEKYATAGKPYKVKYTLQNVSSKTLYDVTLDVIGGKFREAYSVEELIHNGEIVDLTGLTGEFNDGVELKAEEFAPTDTLSGVFEIMFAEGIDLDHINYMVSEMFTFTGPGSTTTIPTEIKLVDVVLEHEFDDGVVTREATCTREGELLLSCTDCDHTETRVIAKTEHKLGDWVVRREPTCVRKGEKYKKCENCTYTITAELLEGAHQWDDGKITVKPTEETEGIRTYTCTKCGETKTEKVPVLVKQEIYFVTGETMNRVYNGSGEVIYNKADNDSENGGKITYTSSDASVAAVDNEGRVTIYKTGTTTITATAAETEAYVETSASYTLTVAKAPLTVKANDITVFYGDKARENGYTVTGLKGNDRESVLGGSASYEFTYEAFAPIGEYEVSVSGLTADNYEITFETGKIIVNKAENYVVELANLTQRAGKTTPVTATVTPQDESAEFVIEYKNADGEWTADMPADAGEYAVRAALVSCDNIAADSEKYFEAVLEIKAGALISGSDGSSIGIEIVEDGEEVEYIIPDNVIDSIVDAIPETGEVVIDSSNTTNDTTKLVLPSNIVKAFGESDKAEKLTIIADASEITMDKDVISNIASKADVNEKVRINIEVVDSSELTPEQQAAVDAISPDVTVLQLNMDIISEDEHGNILSTEAVHALGGDVDVRAAFTLPADMTGKRLVVCYVADDGSTTYIRATYADGFVSFKTDHFSHYVLALADCEHEWDNGVVTVPATYEATGLKVVTCTVCGETKEEVIPKKTSGGGGGGSSSSSSYTVSFETNGANAVSSAKVSENKTVQEPAQPVKEGYTFLGWFVDKECTQKYDFTQKVTKSFTLYAGWVVLPGKVFTDVEKDDWFYDAVKFVNERGIMNGVSDTEFAPDGTITRAMVVTMLYRLEGEPQVINRSIPFSDTDMGAYYANAVIWAKQTGIMNGVSENEFAPDMALTREQMATVLYRYAKIKGYETAIVPTDYDYTDATSVSDYAVEAISWAAANGIMVGNPDGSFAPKADLTRAQGATTFMRIIENLAK